MDIIFNYLDFLKGVSLPFAMMGGLAAIIAFLLTPPNYRLALALAIMPIWLTIGRLPDLAMAQVLAKVTSIVPYAAVAFAAFTHPGPRRELSKLAWLLPLVGVMVFLYITNVEDRGAIFIIRFQWLVMAAAALALARVVVDDRMLQYVARSLGVGCLIALIFPFSAMILHPGEVLAGWGRFRPYGANPNQIMPLLVLTAPLLMYLGMRSHGLLKPILFAAMALAAGMTLITGSRAGLIILFIAFIPLGLAVVRRPAMFIAAAVVLLVGVQLILRASPEAAIERLQTLETTRPEIWAGYAEIIAERPLVGLMGQGDSAEVASAVGQHPHNAYIELLYIGGLSFFLPMAVLMIGAVFATVYVWRRRAWYDFDSLLISLFAAFLVAMFAHGFSNSIVLYPTYSWSFLFLFLLAFFPTTKRAIKNGQMLPADGVWEQQWEDGYQPDDQYDGYMQPGVAAAYSSDDETDDYRGYGYSY